MQEQSLAGSIGDDGDLSNARWRCAPRWPISVFVAAAAGSSFLYAAYTDHIWEDFFITFRHSENLVQGQGLVYWPGERVHGFTSPLGVLLPALCLKLTGERSYGEAIWAFRLLSILAYVTAGILLLGRVQRESNGRGLSWWGLAGLMTVEVKSIAFSVNGMETAFLLMFLAGTLALVARDDVARRWLPLGICWAGLMWVRPDSCILIAAATLAELLFGPASPTTKLRDLIRAAGVCTLLYLPWFGWAWTYYGSPIPHSVLAKMNLGRSADPALGVIGRYVATTSQVFLPIYHNLGNGQGWHPLFRAWAAALGLLGVTYWLLPVRDRWTQACSLMFAIMTLYLTWLSFSFPWYLPPVTLLGLVVAAQGLPRLTAPWAARLRRRWLPAAGLLSMVAIPLFLIYVLTAFQMRIQARVVEMGNRAELGRWLAARMQPGERVYVECLGYIGYFSRAKMADWPGLVSPEVVAVAREHGTDFATTLGRVDPEWAVLRPWEAEEVARRDRTFHQQYELVKSFDVNPDLYALRTPTLLQPLVHDAHLPGIGYLTYDAKFFIFRRHEAERIAD